MLRYGFYRNFEFRVSGPGLIREQGESNFGDVDLGIKYHLLDEGTWTPAIGLLPVVTLPTASGNAGSSNVNPRFFLLFDKDLPLDFGVEWVTAISRGDASRSHPRRTEGYPRIRPSW
ncbi:MAG: transporter [Chitinophagales bacterium]